MTLLSAAHMWSNEEDQKKAGDLSFMPIPELHGKPSHPPPPIFFCLALAFNSLLAVAFL